MRRHTGNARDVLECIRIAEVWTSAPGLTSTGLKRLERAARRGMDCLEFADRGAAWSQGNWHHREFRRLEFLREDVR